MLVDRSDQAKFLASLFADPNSIASQTTAAYSELLDEVILDVREMDARVVGRRTKGGGGANNARSSSAAAALPPLRSFRTRCASFATPSCAPSCAPSCTRNTAHSQLTHQSCKPNMQQVAVEAHREARLGLAPPPPPPAPPPPQPLPPLPGARGPTDVFGQAHPPSALEQIACMRCGRKVAAGRFAPHLEKCLGGGRQSSRQRRAAHG